MAKFVHVEAARVRSGMRMLEELLADDKEWTAERERLKEVADEIRHIRDRDHVLKADQPGSVRVGDYLTRPHSQPDEPGRTD